MAREKGLRTAVEDLDSLSPEEVADYKAQSTMKSSSTMSKGVPIIAKGDSWFDFLPGTDLIDCLRARHNLTIRNYSKAGDTLENMILGNSTDEHGTILPPGISRALADVRQIKPRYFLFSGGGNDVAGDGFANYLNHSHGGFPTLLKQDTVTEAINIVFKKYIVELIEAVHKACPQTKVVMHGYGYALPSGKGTKFFGFTFSGPWLRPGLNMKGISLGDGQQIINKLIDTYNEMLAQCAAESEGNMLYVDLRGTIGADDWRDELHLKNSAYALAADRLARFLT